MDYGFAHATVYGDFFMDLSRETLIQSQSLCFLNLYSADFSAQKTGSKVFMLCYLFMRGLRETLITCSFCF